MLSEISQTQKDKYLMIPLTWCTQQIWYTEMEVGERYISRKHQGWKMKEKNIIEDTEESIGTIPVTVKRPGCCSVANCSTPCFPILQYLLGFAQTHVHWTGDAIQPSHPLSPPSPPAVNLSQHQGLFQRDTT